MFLWYYYKCNTGGEESMLKVKNFVLKHPELFTILGLCILFYFIFFHNIWAYALMDVDETRYVSMAEDMYRSKNFLTLYLNHQYFFEKPPLYFWGECLSFAIFGKINEFTARFPVALYGTLSCFLTYFMGRKLVSRTYGVVAALIQATSMEFLILAKFAILDIVVSTGYASNLVNQKEFYFNSCHAHAFYNATTAIKREGEYLHGQIVSFGVLVLHAYYQEDDQGGGDGELHRSVVPCPERS